MPWIQSHSVLRNHKKVREAARELGISRVQLIGHLHLLWHSVIDLCEDGDISCWSIEDISFYAEWQKDPSLFFNACKDRFIDVKGRKNSVKIVHDWLEYSWTYLERKYHTSNPQRLEKIKEKYKKIGCTKVQPKGQPKVQPKDVLKYSPIDVKDVKEYKDKKETENVNNSVDNSKIHEADFEDNIIDKRKEKLNKQAKDLEHIGKTIKKTIKETEPPETTDLEPF